MPRNGPAADIRWIGIDPVYVFHVLNAYDDGDAVVMDVVRYDRAFDTEPGEAHRLGPARSWPAGRIDPAADRVSEQRLDDTPVEFPRIDDAVAGRRHRYGYCTRARRPARASRPGRADQVRPASATSRPASTRAPHRSAGRAGVRAGRRRPGRGRGMGARAWSTTPPGTPATWSSWTPPPSPARRWPPSTCRPGCRSGSTARGCRHDWP